MRWLSLNTSVNLPQILWSPTLNKIRNGHFSQVHGDPNQALTSSYKVPTGSETAYPSSLPTLSYEPGTSFPFAVLPTLAACPTLSCEPRTSFPFAVLILITSDLHSVFSVIVLAGFLFKVVLKGRIEGNCQRQAYGWGTLRCNQERN